MCAGGGTKTEKRTSVSRYKQINDHCPRAKCLAQKSECVTPSVVDKGRNKGSWGREHEVLDLQNQQKIPEFVDETSVSGCSLVLKFIYLLFCFMFSGKERSPVTSRHLSINPQELRNPGVGRVLHTFCYCCFQL